MIYRKKRRPGRRVKSLLTPRCREKYIYKDIKFEFVQQCYEFAMWGFLRSLANVHTSPLTEDCFSAKETSALY